MVTTRGGHQAQPDHIKGPPKRRPVFEGHFDARVQLAIAERLAQQMRRAGFRRASPVVVAELSQKKYGGNFVSGRDEQLMQV